MYLTQRCALLLIDVRSCLDQLGDDLAEELSDAVARVTRYVFSSHTVAVCSYMPIGRCWRFRCS